MMASFKLLISYSILLTGGVLGMAAYGSSNPTHTITLTVREYPNSKVIPEKITQKILRATKDRQLSLTPAELAELQQRLWLKRHTPPPATVDLLATCSGWLAQSDQFGRLSLPRQAQTDQITLLITPSIYPVFSANGNIAYWRLTGDAPAVAYQITKKFDPFEEQYYWATTLAPIPVDQPIPLHTLIILAHPAQLYLPEDLTPTTASQQLSLPDIYVKPTNSAPQSQFTHTNLAALNIRPFFGPVRKTYRATPYGLASQLWT